MKKRVERANHIKNRFRNMLSFLMKNKFLVAVFLIILLAAALRFYNYNNRWGLGNDTSRDIAIAREALTRGELPLIGSFSSAGPFVFGPLFYWTIMASYILLPFLFSAPVIILELSSILAVGILSVCGYLLGGKKLALITGILTASSPQLAIRAVALGQHSFITLFTSLTLLAFILFWQKKKIIYAFAIGISIGLALSFHYQAINLLIFFPALIFVPKISFPKKVLACIMASLGFLIPSLPLLIWDSRQNFANTNNILDYLLIGQYRLYVPNSWRLFVFNYLPAYWAMVMGREVWIALFVMFFTGISLLFYTLKRKISGILFTLSLIFYILLFINKFYKGERSEGYLLYLAPFLILFTGWAISKILTLNPKTAWQRLSAVFACLVLSTILLGNFIAASMYLKATNQVKEINQAINILEKKYPRSKFSIYDYNGRSGYQSQSLSILLKMRNKTDADGTPIGLTCSSEECRQKLPRITKLAGENVVDLRGMKEENLKKAKWIKVNQENMYDDLIGWSKKNELRSNFSITNYIMERLPGI